MTSRRRQAAARRRNKQEKTGSPYSGEPAFLLVGILRRPHGLRGEILMAVMTDFPERIQVGSVFLMGNRHEPITIKSIRQHNKGLIVGLEGCPDRTAVEGMSNKKLFVRADDRPPLPEGEYYLHELLGLQVITDQDAVLGHLVEMIETGATNVYVVRPEEGRDILLPAMDEVILAIDLEKKEMRVHLLEGLLPE